LDMAGVGQPHYIVEFTFYGLVKGSMIAADSLGNYENRRRVQIGM
jgi:hypothetical protein